MIYSKCKSKVKVNPKVIVKKAMGSGNVEDVGSLIEVKNVMNVGNWKKSIGQNLTYIINKWRSNRGNKYWIWFNLMKRMRMGMIKEKDRNIIIKKEEEITKILRIGNVILVRMIIPQKVKNVKNANKEEIAIIL